MNNIVEFRKEYPEAYQKLLSLECKIYFNGNKIYEGLYNSFNEENLDELDKYSVIFKLDDNLIYFTIDENKSLDKFLSVVKECDSTDSFIELMRNYRIYNEMLNLSCDLPKIDNRIIIENKSNIFNHLVSLFEFFNKNNSLLKEEGEDEAIPGDGLPDEKEKEKKEKLTKQADIKFTIWKSPNVKRDWLDTSSDEYQKIEYIYSDKKKGLNIDFLLGFDNGSWKLYAGKIGSVSYDDDPVKDLEEHDFAKAIQKALDEVYDMIKDVEENPEEWPQFYINL